MKPQHQTNQNQHLQSTLDKKQICDRLPNKKTTRWVAKRKAQVIDAVRAGALTLDDACRRYDLSVEEFVSWQKQFDEQGLRGLSVTKSKR
jgi:hypothetical protein